MFTANSNFTISCCGNNEHCQLGLGHCEPVTGFVDNSLCPHFVSFAHGMGFNAGICTEGHIWTCGKNNFGQLGLGHRKGVNVFTQVTSDQYFVSVSCGNNYMIALDDCGAIWICGCIDLIDQNQNQKFECSQLYSKYVTELIKLESDRFFTSISASKFNVFCAIDNENNLWGCGENGYGQLGPKIKTRYVKTLTKLSNEDFQSVSCGCNHIGAIKMDGSLWIHGRVVIHGLQKTILEESKLLNLIQIVCGDFCMVALDNNGTLWSCGDGSNTLGVGDYKNQHGWTKVGSGFVSAYLVNGRNVAALDDKGALWFAGNMERMFEFGVYSSSSYPKPNVPSCMQLFSEDIMFIDSKMPRKHRVKASI